MPHASYSHIKVPDGPPDERFVYLSDVLPTAWQAVEYAAIPDGGSVTILGLGPIGDMAARIALHRGCRVIGVDLVSERLERVRGRGAEVIDLREHDDDLAEMIREMTDGRGTDAVIDAVGMEAHGSPGAKLAQQIAGLLPDPVAEKMIEKAGIDRMHAFYLAIDIVRRGGTISLIGVYGGMADPLPMLTIFDKQIQLRMGQANVKRWADDIMPLLTDGDPLGVESFHTHQVPLDAGARGLRDVPEEGGRRHQGAVQALAGRRLGLVARLDPLCAVEAELAALLVGLGRDRLEQVAGVVAEVDPLDDPAHEAVRALVEQRHAVRAGLPGAALELVHLVAGLAAEQLGEVGRVRRHEVDRHRAGAQRDAVRAVLVRDPREEPGRVDARLGREPDQAAGALAVRRDGRDEHRVVELGDQLLEGLFR